jgi:hypothetical protein
MSKVACIVTGEPGTAGSRISVVIDKRFKSFPLDSDVGKRLHAAIKANDSEEVIREIASEDIWAVARTLGANGANVVLDDRDNVRLNGQIVDYGLAGILKRLAKDEDARIEDLMAFLAKVDQNPNKSVANDLYRFLEKGCLPITPEGDFFAFKNVKEDFWSYRAGSEATYTLTEGSEEPAKNTGSAYYPVGGTVWMDRENCDEDRNVTCSRGLHACSYDYLPNFNGGSGKTIIVRINPRDVTAIPTDYNETKLRCCRLDVLADIPYAEAKNYFRAAVDRRHPVAPVAEPAPEAAPVADGVVEPHDWEAAGRQAGVQAAADDHANGYPFGPEIAYPAGLEVAPEDAPFDLNQARQDFSRGFFEGYSTGWAAADAEAADEADDEHEDDVSESDVHAWAEDDGRAQAELDFNDDEYSPEPEAGASYDAAVGYGHTEAYRVAFHKAYGKRRNELKASRPSEADVAAWGEADGREAAGADFDYDPRPEDYSQYYFDAGRAEDYKAAFYAAYAKRWGESKA